MVVNGDAVHIKLSFYEVLTDFFVFQCHCDISKHKMVAVQRKVLCRAAASDVLLPECQDLSDVIL